MKTINISWLLIILFTLFQENTEAQVSIGKNSGLKTDTINKLILDKAKYQVYYNMIFSNDSLQPQIKTECQTILLIGSQYNAFLDYNSLRKDSLYDALAIKKANIGEIVATVLPIGKQIKFKPSIIKNYPVKGEYTFQEMLLSREVYRYVDNNVDIKWTLGKESKMIKGYNCKNATCTYRGRQYTAWYTPDIPISEGPYVFSGLPGLIMEISDTRQHYLFSINGFTTTGNHTPIYLSTDHIIESSRDQVRKAISNAKNDPASIINSLGNAKIDPATLAKLKPKPYNPIELK